MRLLLVAMHLVQQAQVEYTNLRTVDHDTRAHAPPSQVFWGVGVGVKNAPETCTPHGKFTKYGHKLYSHLRTKRHRHKNGNGQTDKPKLNGDESVHIACRVVRRSGGKFGTWI